jgi:hypothetical protein
LNQLNTVLVQSLITKVVGKAIDAMKKANAIRQYLLRRLSNLSSKEAKRNITDKIAL